MGKGIHEDMQFENVDYSGQELYDREFENCTFINCNFTNSKLVSNNLIDCVFKGCNFSMSQLVDTGLKGVSFNNCKLTGIDFSKCNQFSFAVDFENCILDYSIFYKQKLKKTSFRDCSIKQADIAECDLSEAMFVNCDLLQTNFDRNNLMKADFRTATNYAMSPNTNKLKKAKFSVNGLAGLLGEYDLVVNG